MCANTDVLSGHVVFSVVPRHDAQCGDSHSWLENGCCVLVLLCVLLLCVNFCFLFFRLMDVLEE